MPDAALEIEALHHDYGGGAVLRGVDLRVGAGELVAVLGASGCGKTTLLRAVAGFVTPSAGRIAVRGRVVAEGGRSRVPAEGRGVGIVFQDYALFPGMTVRENVAFGLHGRPDGQVRARVAALLDMVGLADLADRRPGALSGGQQQRVALARSLAPDPALLLLDEPFANLDASLRADVRDELRRILGDAGGSALLVTHDRAEALAIADRVAVLGPGPDGAGAAVLQCAPPEEVYARPASRRVAALTGEATFVAAVGRPAGDAWADSPLGPLPLHAPSPGAALVLLRPESLRFVQEADAAAPCVVRSRQFLGRCVRLRVDSPAGPLVIEAPAADAPPPEARGAVRPVGPCHALPADGAP